VCNSSCAREDQAEYRVARATETNYFTADTILLGCECQGDESDPMGIWDGYGGGKEPLLSDPALHVLQSERGGFRSGSCILTGTGQKEEGECDHVGNSLGARHGSWCRCQGGNVTYDLDRNGLYTVRRRVSARVAPQLLLDAEVNIAMLV
jgi:hypothetical protein